MEYPEAAAHIVTLLTDGKHVLEALESKGAANPGSSPPAGRPTAAADRRGPAGPQAGRPAKRQPSEGERRLAEIGAAVARHMHLLIVWNASTFLAVCARNHHSRAEFLGS